MEEIDELIPHPDQDGVLSLTHRALIILDSVIWTMKKELMFLNISFNNIEYLPPELGDLLLLRELDVSCNKLEALPPEISKCQRLRKLKGNGNYIKTIPDGLGGCCLLEELSLSENRLQDIPASLAGLKALRVLRLQNNDLKTLPYVMSAVVSLEELDCAGNSEFDLVPEAWRSDPTMILWICRLHQEHSDEVRELENLNCVLEQRTQSSEEAKLRLKEEIRVFEEQRRALLKERPGVYLAAKRQVDSIRKGTITTPCCADSPAC